MIMYLTPATRTGYNDGRRSGRLCGNLKRGEVTGGSRHTGIDAALPRTSSVAGVPKEGKGYEARYVAAI